MAQNKDENKSKSRKKSNPPRPKLDPRLALLLTLTDKQRQKLKETEDARLGSVEKEVGNAVAALDVEDEKGRRKALERLRQLDLELFAPLTAGLFIPETKPRQPLPIRLKEPFIAAFILSDASAGDLKRLGARIRSKVGDIYTAFIQLTDIPKLEKSAAVRFIELARPLFRTLNTAVPFSQLNTLHSAMPAINGTGVVVGIVDSRLDIYHPDFRTAANATRVLFLWDQTLAPTAGEAGPPIAPALPGFVPAGGVTYGVEYNQATIDSELINPPPAYQIVRHGGTSGEHGTHVAGIAAGNGLGQAGTFTGGAPGAGIIFVRQTGAAGTALFGDSVGMADAFSYIFARAALLGQPCVINMSASDNQGPHDGMTLGEQFLDNLLLTPGRAITLSAGNSNNTGSHAAGNVAVGGTSNLVINYASVDINGDGINDLPISSDDIEIWYDGHDRFSVTVTVPTAPATVIGPVAPGASTTVTLPGGVQVQITSVLNDPRNGDNLISIIFNVPAGQNIPLGNTTIALTGTTVINGAFQAWVDRNNRGFSSFQAPFLQEGTLTLGVPATARRPITVGNHNKTAPTPGISGSSGRGPTRDRRIKPEIATVGSSVTAPRSRNMNSATPGGLYTIMSGTSMSAPLVAGACACLFQCRGGTSTWANLKQILEDTAGTTGLAIPGNSFGFGFMQVSTGCAAPPPSVDVWLRDSASDTGSEPFTGPVSWLSPDIEVLDTSGAAVPNPTFDPVKRFNNIIRITVRNRGTNTARNTEVYFYWADPATNIPYPAAWNATGIYNDSPGFVNQSNMIVIPQLAPGASTQVLFGWAPPAPGSNISGDDHFCLLVRLENESDLSQIGMGGWSSISARNNIALHNVHVQPDDLTDNDMSFYVVGSDDQDGLILYSELAGGRLSLSLPVQALPWRDIKIIEEYNGQRAGFGCCGAIDPLVRHREKLRGEKILAVTDIVGAELLEVDDGVANIAFDSSARLYIPYLQIAEGAKMPVKIHVRNPKVRKENRFVHIAQYSGGQLIGGVSLELRPRKKGRKG